MYTRLHITCYLVYTRKATHEKSIKQSRGWPTPLPDPDVATSEMVGNFGVHQPSESERSAVLRVSTMCRMSPLDHVVAVATIVIFFIPQGFLSWRPERVEIQGLCLAARRLLL